MTKIKWGSTRVVVLWRQWAFKIPYIGLYKNFLLGLVANLDEYNFYIAFKDSGKLAPIIFKFPFGICNIMKRAEYLTREEFYKLDFDNWIKIENSVLPVENKWDSFGVIDKAIVAIDYH